MARFYGTIGFVLSQENETRPGVWVDDTVVERNYYGEITRSVHRWDRTEKVNDDITISNTISIIADSYLLENSAAIRYVVRNGVKWKVSEIEELRPRLILTLGGVWNG